MELPGNARIAMQIMDSGINNFPYIYQSNASRDALPRVAILSVWLRYFNDLAVGETAAPRMLFAGERGGGRNANAAKPLK
jgi:hypothetical protein